MISLVLPSQRETHTLWVRLLAVLISLNSFNLFAQNGAPCYKPLIGPGTTATAVQGGGATVGFTTGNGVENLNNGNTADYAEIANLLSVASNQGVSVANANTTYPAGFYAGYVVRLGNNGLLSARVLEGIQIQTFNDGVLAETRTFPNGLGVTLLSGDSPDKVYLSFKTTQPFDEVRLIRGTLANLTAANSLRIYYATAFDPACGTLDNNGICEDQIAGNQTVVNFNPGVVNALATLANANNITDGDKKTFATLVLPAGVGLVSSPPFVGVKSLQTIYPAGGRVGFVIQQVGSLLAANVLGRLRIQTYLHGELQDNVALNDNAVLVGAALLGGTDPAQKVSIPTTLPYNEVRLVVAQNASVNVGTLRIYYAFESGASCTDCEDILAVGGTYPNAAIVNSRTGGSLCVGIGSARVNDEDLVVNGDYTDYGRIRPPSLGVGCDGSISVRTAAASGRPVIPANAFAGFIVSKNGNLLDLSVLGGLRIRTYLNGNLRDDSDANGISLVGLSVLSGGTGLTKVGIKTTQSFDEIRITVDFGLLGTFVTTDAVRVYYAFVQRDDDNDGVLDCNEVCGTGAGQDDSIDSDGDGTPNACDACSTVNNKSASADTDGDGLSNNCDVDSDNDGILDTVEDTNGDGDPNNDDQDGDGIPNYLDLDSDNDGILDLYESGLTAAQISSNDPDNNGVLNGQNPVSVTTPRDTDGDGVPDYLDLDSDNDGIKDLIESGFTSLTDADNNGVVDGPDADNDGIQDSADGNDAAFGSASVTAPRNTDGDNSPDYRDLDSDNDGIKDLTESGRPNLGTLDANNDGVLDGADADGDGMRDNVDTEDAIFGSPEVITFTDTDSDTVPNYLDLDSDNDGIKDLYESGLPNPGTLDPDGNGVINAVTDADNDGIEDAADGSTGTFGSVNTGTPRDTDGDTVPDYRDLDSDNDGIKDLYESGLPNLGTIDSDGNGVIDTGTDADRDGVQVSVDSNDGSFGSVNAGTPRDTDGDTVPDFQDLDSDNDGIKDLYESGISNPGTLDPDGNGVINTGTDADNDGIQASVDSNDALFGSTDNPTARDTDSDTVPDYRDLDSDNDGIKDLYESGVPSPGTLDADGNGAIDTGTDADRDGIQDSIDNAPGTFGSTDNPTLRDTDSDTVPNYRDLDSDNDGIKDLYESGLPNLAAIDTDGNGVIDTGADADKDGVQTSVDTNDNLFGSTDLAAPLDTDGDNVPDVNDLDSDNDGINDIVENGNPAVVDANGDGMVDGADNDKDGILGGADTNDGVFGSPNSPAPLNSDDDPLPNFQDLDSDNDSVSDLVESGQTGYTDSPEDGVVDGPDNDGDGIQDSVDGAPGTFGDANSPAPKNTDGTDTPDYIDTDSNNDGTNDIVSNGNGGLDGNNDGKVDNPTDPDNDGIANNGGLDEKPTEFGGLSQQAGTPDLTPSVFSNGGTYNVNEQKDVVIVIYNTGDGATSGPVTFELNKLTPSFTIAINPNATTTNVTSPAVTMPPTVNNSEWTFTEQATRYVVTLKDGFSIPAGGNKKIVIQVTATNTPNAAATITARVFNGTGGGETPTTNNSAVYLISINDSNN